MTTQTQDPLVKELYEVFGDFPTGSDVASRMCIAYAMIRLAKALEAVRIPPLSEIEAVLRNAAKDSRNEDLTVQVLGTVNVEMKTR